MLLGGVKIALAGEFSLNSKTIVNHELLGTNEDSLGSKPVGKVCKKVEYWQHKQVSNVTQNSQLET